MNIAPSPFDDELFGFRFGRVRVGSADEVAQLEAALRDAPFDCVYIQAEGTDLPAWLAGLTVGRVVAMDERIDFGKDGVGDGAEPSAPCRWLSDPAPMREIAGAAFLNGRFAQDERLASKERTLYERWCDVGCTPPRSMLGCFDAAVPVGFLITSADDDTTARCELIGVAAERRGTGVGTRLMNAWEAGLPPGTTVRVKAQGGNEPAGAFYRGLGYHEVSRDCVAHLWLT